MTEQEQTEIPFEGDDAEDPSAEARALIGDEAIAKLTKAGFALARSAELDRFEAETEARVERLSKLAKVAMEAAKVRAFIFEVRAGHHADTTIEMLICDPSGDEEAMARKIAAGLKLVTQGRPKRDRRAARVKVSPPRTS